MSTAKNWRPYHVTGVPTNIFETCLDTVDNATDCICVLLALFTLENNT